MREISRQYIRARTEVNSADGPELTAERRELQFKLPNFPGKPGLLHWRSLPLWPGLGASNPSFAPTLQVQGSGYPAPGPNSRAHPVRVLRLVGKRLGLHGCRGAAALRGPREGRKGSAGSTEEKAVYTRCSPRPGGPLPLTCSSRRWAPPY